MRLAMGCAGLTDRRLIEHALTKGIRSFDTALAYGNEELLRDVPESCEIVTKVPKGANVNHSIIQSQLKIGKNRLHGLLLHHADDMNLGTFTAMSNYKRAGIVERIGVSCYEPREIPAYNCNIIQFPMNILDQRFVPYLKRLKARNMQIWVRSAFLQGILLDRTKQKEHPLLQRKLMDLPNNKTARLAFCLNFFNQFPIDRLIVGFEKPSQLNEIMDCMAMRPYEDFSSQRGMDPRKWS